MNNHLKTFFSNQWVELACRCSLGLLFVIASFHKISNPAQFAKIIYGYQLVPDIAINLITIMLPFLELFSGAALIAGIYPRSAVTIINAMLLSFIVAISINLLRGHVFDCGCFSTGDTNHPSAAAALLVRDLVCLAVGSYVIGYTGKPKFCITR
ncbi:MAG: MauE/DoxX family redox-associated membrane protein [Pseudomonadota bacterium]